MTRADLHLVRHAQASFGAEEYDALSETGRAQAAALGAALAKRLPRVDRVVCGRMRRHRETAEACLDAMKLDVPVEEDAGWDEYDHRDVIRAHEPRYADHALMVEELLAADDPRRAFQRMFAAAVARWAGGEHDADYREPWPAFASRVAAALARLEDAGTALVFTSAGPILAACQRVLRIPTPQAIGLGWSLANASVTRLVVGASGARLASFNEQGHFSGEHAPLLTFR